MSEKQKTLIETLPEKLGLPGRFGRVALAETFTPTELAQVIIEPDTGATLYPDLPETHMMYGARRV